MNTSSKTMDVILVVDDTPANVKVIMEMLSVNDYKVLVAVDGESALEQISYMKPSLVLLDIMMPGIDGFETCRRLKANPKTQDIPIIFMTSLHEIKDKVKGFQLGAVDYITKPFQGEEVLTRVRNHLTIKKLRDNLETEVLQRTQELSNALDEVKILKEKLEAENNYLLQELQQKHHFQEIITQSNVFKTVLKKVEQVAPTQATVLVLGESGTGKELLARAIHKLSTRSEKTLVKLNCAALPATLIESELFGHEKGAFTGAIQSRVGRFELANQGTLFLDEVGELPLDTQAKLLRILQEGELERVGSSKTLKIDVRIIAATNKDLQQEIQKGNFREDLFYRLNVFPILNPPLRDRKEDIPILVQHFLKKYKNQIGKSFSGISKKSLNHLYAYDWPGNIRELENVIERSMIISSGSKLQIEPLRQEEAKDKSFLTITQMEKKYILKALEKTRWKISGKGGAAELLDINPKTLASRMKKLGIGKS